MIRDAGNSGPADPVLSIRDSNKDFLMAIWNEKTTVPQKDALAMSPEPAVKKELDYPADLAPSTARRAPQRETKESVIASDITITGRIEGSGHIRIAGRFEGDVNIQGDLTVEAGAKLTGSVHANSVTIGGEVEGNIESAASVELLSTGVLNGDLKAGNLTVASGSKMRGRAEFGWGDDVLAKAPLTLSNRQVS
jgi:cytoskeletal protein CcmA (bactofilin family)